MELILEQHRKLAYDAHRNVSFDPEKRADSVIKDYSKELSSDLEDLNNDQNYKEKYVRYFTTWLSAKSRTFSTMITGPANVNLNQHAKANRSEQNRYEEFRNWRENYFKVAERIKRNNRTESEKSQENWEWARKVIINTAKTIYEIDNGINTYTSRNLMVRVIVGNVTTAINNGDVERVQKSLDLIRELQKDWKKPIVTDKHVIWKGIEQAEVIREKKVDIKVQEPKEIKFEDGRVVLNYNEDRIQIFHDKKPEQEMIQSLKKRVFKWSPKMVCWQRKLTLNAIYDAENILKIKIQ